MLQYKRNIKVWLFIMRFLLVAGVGAIVFFVINDQTLSVMIIAGVLLLMAFIKIRGIHVYSDHFLLQEYYWFALKGKEWTINKSHKSHIESFFNGEMTDVPETGTWLDVLLLPVIFIGLLKSGKRGIKIKGLPDEGGTKNVRITLNKREYHFIDNTGVLQ